MYLLLCGNFERVVFWRGGVLYLFVTTQRCEIVHASHSAHYTQHCFMCFYLYYISDAFRLCQPGVRGPAAGGRTDLQVRRRAGAAASGSTEAARLVLRGLQGGGCGRRVLLGCKETGCGLWAVECFGQSGEWIWLLKICYYFLYRICRHLEGSLSGNGNVPHSVSRKPVASPFV